jgi:outer membrane lipoprotein SlyB
MKKGIIIAVCSTMLLSGCDTYTGAGAYTGSTLGAILGSAIGGLSDGPRGSDIGQIIGMAGGAIVGGAVGAQADKAKAEEYSQYQQDREERQYQRQQNQVQQYSSQNQGSSDSSFDSSNSNDDRIYDFGSKDYTGNYTATQPRTTMPSTSSVEDLATSYTYTSLIEIQNARFVDSNQDKVINADELCKIIFEVKNVSNETVYDVVPSVVETTGNKHIFISPSIHVEKIMPGKGIRYTAMVKADKRLKDGDAKFCISVLQGGKEMSKVTEFSIPTRR